MTSPDMVDHFILPVITLVLATFNGTSVNASSWIMLSSVTDEVFRTAEGPPTNDTDRAG